MADLAKLQEAINKSIAALSEVSSLLSEGTPTMQAAKSAAAAPKIEVVPQTATVPKAEVGDEFSQLKEILYGERWPDAVNKNLICDPDSEQDKIERGRGIVELMIEEDLNGLKVLDFGCGEGQCAFVSTDYGTSLSVGYDIKENKNWDSYEKPNLIMTTNWDQVVASGPYDTIILFDVLDHSVSEDPTELLKKANQVLNEDGKIYMRCHPWVSRHATHLYHDINKAYIHLVFSPDELKEMVPESKFFEESSKITKPILSYSKHIEDAELKVQNRRDITEKVEPFFKVPLIQKRIIKNTGFGELPEFQMSLQFLDYVLVKA